MLDTNTAAATRRADDGFRDAIGNLITPSDFDTIEQHANRYSTTLVIATVALGFLKDAAACEAFARSQGRPFADLHSTLPNPTAARLLPERVARAVAADASDIHLEPGPSGAVVRERVCGILEPLLTLPESSVRGVTNRFKLIAKADIATRMKPQDGAFRVIANDLDMVRGDRSLQATPVVVLTSESSSDVETRVLEMGADDDVVKPFEPEVLTSRVRAAFRRAVRAA